MIKLVYLTWTTLFFSACKLKGGRGKDLFQKLSTNKSASQYWGYILTYMIQTVLILYLSLRCKIALRQTSNWTAKQNDLLSDQIRLRTQKIWWSLGGSNSWPPECKSGALPAELRPQRSPRAACYVGCMKQPHPFRDTAARYPVGASRLTAWDACWRDMRTARSERSSCDALNMVSFVYWPAKCFTRWASSSD